MRRMAWMTAVLMYFVAAVGLCALLYVRLISVAFGGELYRDPQDATRRLWCDAGECRWLEQEPVSEVTTPEEPEPLISDFPCAVIRDYRGMTVEPATVPLQLARGGLCVLGGTWDISAAAGAPQKGLVGLWGEADPFLAQSVMVVGLSIGVRAGPNESSLFVRDSFFGGITDTCVDNLEGRPGHITGTVFNGCHRFYASRDGAATVNTDLMVIENSVILMSEGAAAPFDVQGGPALGLKDVTFLIEGSPTSGKPGLPKLKECHNVTVVYTGPSELGDGWPADCVTVTNDQSVWEAALEVLPGGRRCVDSDRVLGL